MNYLALAAAVACIVTNGVAYAGEEAGRAEYAAACAGCHGESAQGNGPLASTLKIAPPNLTQLAARNDGEFPFLETLRIVDGREDVRAHGSAMPVWGDRFVENALITEYPAIAELVARGRVLSLVYFLESIQE